VRLDPFRSPPSLARLSFLVFAAVALICGVGAAPPRPLPPIVFVSRAAPPDSMRGVIPGLGPAGRRLAPGGRLMLRESDGRLRALVADSVMWDVSDPSVSFDAREVAFAGVEKRGGPWRLWRVRLDGTGLERLTGDASSDGSRARGPAGEVNDFDPCWVAPGVLVFASTRYTQVAQYAPLAATNLFRLDLNDRAPRRITPERNGAEEPAYDPRTGRVLFARWWFNRHHAGAGAGGLAEVRAGTAAAESANVWHVMSVPREGGVERVEAGDFRTRAGAMGYQPCALADGGIAAVFASNTGLVPSGVTYGIQRLDRAGGPSRRIAGAALPAPGESAYGTPRGLAAPAACSPAALPDGRVLFAFDPSGRGDFGIVIADADGEARTMVADLTGTLELDPVPVIARRAPGAPLKPTALRASPARTLEELLAPSATFRYDNSGLFKGRGAPAFVPGARIRFFATLDRAGAEGGDSAVLVRERPVQRDGRVSEAGLPADVPMFEQLVDSAGRVLRGPLGAAHVAGLNAGPPGATLRCVGCHVGHSRAGR
jgi:hypothetical protein